GLTKKGPGEEKAPGRNKKRPGKKNKRPGKRKGAQGKYIEMVLCAMVDFSSKDIVSFFICPVCSGASTVKFPYFVDLKRPDKRGIKGCKNFYIKVNEKVTLGAWHTLPQQNRGDNQDLKLNSGHPIILYLHGNAAT
ncbi:hypothetical protein AM593_01246, partial [Mytilus galloprovincialis]